MDNMIKLDAVATDPSQPVQPQPQSVGLQRSPHVAEAFINLHALCVRARRTQNRLLRMDTQKVHQLLVYIEALEHDIIEQRTEYIKYRAVAEGTIAERRMVLRGLRTLLLDVFDATIPEVPRWWWSSKRRVRNEALVAQQERVMEHIDIISKHLGEDSEKVDT